LFDFFLDLDDENQTGPKREEREEREEKREERRERREIREIRERREIREKRESRQATGPDGVGTRENTMESVTEVKRTVTFSEAISLLVAQQLRERHTAIHWCVYHI